MGCVLRRIDDARDGYAAIVRRLVRVRVLGVVAVLAAAAAIYGLSLRTPTGFLPEEDQGAFFISVQLPDGASVSRTSDVVKPHRSIAAAMPQVAGRVRGRSAIRSSTASASRTPAFIVAKLKPFADRDGAANSAQALIGARVRARGSRSAPPRSSPSTCRRSSVCRPAAVSNTSSKASKGRTQPPWAASCRA